MTLRQHGKWLALRALMAIGIDLHLRTEDRRVLEQVLLPALSADDRLQSILFVGCDWYTRGYRRFFRGRSYVTLDIDPANRRCGAREHIVDALQNLGHHVPVGSLDLILVNGVIGYGLDERADIEAAFDACLVALRPQGILLLGWNDIAGRRPSRFDESTSLRGFEPMVLAPIGGSRIVTATPNRHIFSFHLKA